TNGCGISYDTLLVTLNTLTPALSLGPDIVLCTGTTINIFITEPNVEILWSDGSTENHFLVTDTITQVYASITNGCGESSDTVGVSLLPGIPSLDLGPDQSLCIGEVITFSPGITGVNYVWQDGSTNSSFQATQPTTVILTISNVCGTAKDTVVITEDTNGPQVDLGPDILACEGEMTSIPAGISGVTYLWQDGSTADEFVATTSGWVYVTVNNLCGTDIDSVFVDLSGVVPDPDLGVDTTLCEGISIQLISNADASTSITWQDGSSTPNFQVTTAGTYTLTETNQCGSSTDEITISYTPLPLAFDLGPDTSLCPGESFVLMAPQTADQLRWQDGSSGASMVVDKEQVYSLQISNRCGINSDSLLVSFNMDLPQIILSTPVSLCPGEQITLDVQQTFDADYLWSTGQTDPVITVSSPGNYSVEVAAACVSSSGQVEVIEIDDCDGVIDVFIPNVFSPNDDQVNDEFILSFDGDQQVTAIEGSIFDRWGNLVFNSTKDPFEWDGKFNEEKVMPGVYVYLIKLTYILEGEEREEVFAGDVTVVR
ncbi:MAG TPA: gliding motility-associated C-terminal domain-containing protein, partial [Saprospiraceae bacterium]